MHEKRRNCPSDAPTHRPVRDARAAYAERIRKVIEYIDTHLDRDLSVQRLAQVANFSVFHFHRQFRAATGVTVARLVRLLRLKRASVQLAFNPSSSITEIALASGFESLEAFSRAFKQAHGQSPSEFRQSPTWRRWQRTPITFFEESAVKERVDLVEFPATRVAAVEYQGPEQQSLSATLKLIAWRREHGVSPDKGSTYGIHYSDRLTTPPEAYRLDVCVSYDGEIGPNDHGVVEKLIPAGRCARIRHFGSRENVTSADYLYREWLPASAEELRDFPIFFHYVNVGPNVADREMITDVYLPLRRPD